VKRALEWSKIIFSERRGIRATDQEALKRRDGGVLLQRSKKERLLRDYENTWSESPEIPVLGEISEKLEK
jgi:hypothetical protein